eukprot:TRINITY_DN6720_c0_g1_i1.p1 TRINITY_DN6720_c0_g1~~TRINITY_DN6720_c0_g1_i1.p1  ORF type:complete len:195 (-),score=36.11 TRINITY_DN6720_c0_g1_i1:501-1085(-)
MNQLVPPLQVNSVHARSHELCFKILRLCISFQSESDRGVACLFSDNLERHFRSILECQPKLIIACLDHFSAYVLKFLVPSKLYFSKIESIVKALSSMLHCLVGGEVRLEESMGIFSSICFYWASCLPVLCSENEIPVLETIANGADSLIKIYPLAFSKINLSVFLLALFVHLELVNNLLGSVTAQLLILRVIFA